MTELFALDLGNKQTKLKSSKGDYCLPSQFLKVDVKGAAIIDNSYINGLNINTFNLVDGNTKKYTWGNDIYELNQSNKLVETMTFNNRYTKDNFKLLANFALGLLAKDFETSTEDYLDVNVVTGVPTNTYLYESEQCDYLANNVLKGRHNVSIDGVNYKINVKGVTIISQPMGTLLDLIASDKKTHLQQESVSIIDLGGGTLLVDTIENMMYSKTNTKQYNTGITSLMRDIEANLTNMPIPTDSQMQQILRVGTKTKEYYFKPNSHDEYNISDVVNEQIDNYTNTVLENIDYIVSNNENSSIIFTGGGSSVINSKIVKNVYPRAIFAKHGEKTNVYGFYEYGKQQNN